MLFNHLTQRWRMPLEIMKPHFLKESGVFLMTSSCTLVFRIIHKNAIFQMQILKLHFKKTGLLQKQFFLDNLFS
jgi:hypothetical protein